MRDLTRTDTARARAEAYFKVPQAIAGIADQTQSERPKETEADKIAKLRALRLEKEQRDKLAAEIRRARRQQR